MKKHEVRQRKVLGAQQITSHCLVCGTDNPSSLHARFLILEDDKLAVEIQPREDMQSYPDRMHGGVISTVLDELLNRTVLMKNPEVTSVTIELTVKFRKPVPLDRPMRGIGWIEKNRSRTYDARGQIILEDGSVAAEGFGRFALLSPKDVGGEEGVRYFFDDDRVLPEIMEI